MSTALPHFPCTLLALAITTAWPLQARAAPSAGMVQFIAGDVNVRRADGKAGPLAKGNDLESGQSILTGAGGRAQLRFSDGGIISLQPNTEFRIANYVDLADPHQDRFLVELLRGSMRAITGLIGKRNRENYRVTTATATIGIRGSGFNVGYNPDGSVSVTTELDAIEVCSAGNCIGLMAGESARVFSATGAPVRTRVRAAIPLPGHELEPLVAGTRVNGKGSPAIIPEHVPGPINPATPPDGASEPVIPDLPNTGSFSDLRFLSRYWMSSSSYSAGGTPASATVLDAGKVTAVTNGSYTFRPVTVGSEESRGSTANGDFIGWGKWTSATKDSTSAPGSPTSISNFSYVVGQPTVIMPVTGIVNYNWAGGTAPTSYMGNSGTLQAASLSADFGTRMVTASVTTSFSASPLTGTMGINGSSFGNASFEGFFSGPNASRAGMSYTGYAGGGSYSGVAVFQAP